MADKISPHPWPVQHVVTDERRLITVPWLLALQNTGKKAEPPVEPPGTGEDYEEATFVLYDTREAVSVTNPLPVRRGGELVEAVIVPKAMTTAAFSCDIRSNAVSVFGAAKLDVPSGTAGNGIVTQTVFAADPLLLETDDILTLDILDSDAESAFTVVLRWKV